MGEQEITEADLFSETKRIRDGVSAIFEESFTYIHTHIHIHHTVMGGFFYQ